MQTKMDKCYFSKKHRIERIIHIVAMLLYSVILWGISIIPAISTPRSLGLAAILACLGWAIFLYGIFFNLYMSREYALSEDGITIRYAKRKSVFYPWADVGQICVCTIHQGKIESIKDDVIWCTVGKIKKEPPNLPHIWNVAETGMIHFRDVLTMEYTPERLADFQKYSNRDIPDYCDRR